MKEDAAPNGNSFGPVDRVLGRIRGSRGGPTLLCVGGLHGNEQAGVKALQSVLHQLGSRSGEISGDFVAVAGNLAALELGCRYIERDLNRAWTEARLAALRNGGPKGPEDREQLELLYAIEQVVEEARGPVYVLDLHTTSGFGAPFSTFGDTLPNRDFADHLPVPMVLGLEELVKGTLLAFLGSHGLVAIAFESGQHYEPESVQRAEAGIWLAVAAARLLPESSLPMLPESRKILQREVTGLPRALEMSYRHNIEPSDRFRMRPGYRNFQRVRQGEALGRDARGDVTVRETARILMPLYQEQGDDGYFLVREFGSVWLRISYVLRCLGAERWAHVLPGVTRDRLDPDVVRVDRHVARGFAKQVFHLLGFRELEESGEDLVMRRRRFDEARFVARGPTPEHLV